MIGTTIGNFELISPLGRGGMGEVWLAQQKSLKTKVAIKILAAEISTNTTHIQRFRNEAIAVSQIPHSGIVKMFDTGDLPDGRAYLVMEYLEGETLANRIKRMGRLDLALIADFGRQIASVLDATHKAGITHRDLKPDNIYIVRDAELARGERIKILDFGIAKLDITVGPQMTAASVSSIGTPNYMSPEQWHSLHEVGWQTDAYALGCVAFEMAVGRPPFVAETRVEVCAMHLGEPPPVPSSRVPIPAAFDRIVSRLLEKEPGDRPTMRETIAVFTALGETEGIALSTLPPRGMISPLANRASSSMPFKTTPRAGLPSEPNPIEMPLSASDLRHREDATPVANMSLQFKPTPVAGFESQTNLRAQTDPATSASIGVGNSQFGNSQTGASQPMHLVAKTKSRKSALLILAGVAVAATIVIAIVATRGGEHVVTSDAAVATGTIDAAVAAVDAAVAAVDASAAADADVVIVIDAARKRALGTLPTRKPGLMPLVTDPLELEVCIDREGQVTGVVRHDGKLLAKAIDAMVATWEYAHPADEVCGLVTLSPRVDRKPGTVTLAPPQKLSPKMLSDGIATVTGAFAACGRDESTIIQLTVDVTPEGVGTVTEVSASAPTRTPAVVRCLENAVSTIRFTRTQQGGKGNTTVRFGG